MVRLSFVGVCVRLRKRVREISLNAKWDCGSPSTGTRARFVNASF